MSETQRYAMIAMGEGHSGHHGAPAPIVDRPDFHGHRDLVVRVVSSVDEVVVADWDGLARAQAQAVFFDRRFLRGVEAGVEPGLECHYALFYEGERPVGLGYFQIADFVGQPVGPLLERAPATVAFAARSLKLLEKVFRVRLIVCGNAFTSGQHGFAFLPEVSPDRAVRGLLDAVEHIRQGQTEPAGTSKPAATAVLFKDFDHDAAAHRIAGRLRDHGFSDLETQPNMVLDIDPSWDGYEDYLQSLASKYRVKANRAFAKSRDLVVRDLDLEDLAAHETRFSVIYDAVLDRADYRLGRQTAAAFAALRRDLGEELVLRGFFLGERLVGFSSGFVTDGVLETQCVGLDYELNRDLAIYPRMLYDYLQVAMARGLRQVNYGRTASEIKSTLGAEPVGVSCYVRHEQRAVNKLLPLLSRYIRMESDPVRRPFKQAFYVAREEKEAKSGGVGGNLGGDLGRDLGEDLGVDLGGGLVGGLVPAT